MVQESRKYLKGKGITKLINVANQIMLKNYQNLDQYKDIFYQCGKCGNCRTAYQENGWPRVCPSGEYGKFEAYYLGGKNLLTWGLNSGKLEWTENLARIFYQCSVCHACLQQCNIPEIHNYAGEWLMAMREEAVKKGFGPMKEHTLYTDHILNEYNPYLEKHEKRLNWLTKDINLDPSGDIAYFVGCTSSYREQTVALATAEILSSMHLKFKILKEEHCCGSPVFMTGQAEKAKEIAENNVNTFSEEGIKKIITSCAGCYRMWKEVYPNKFKLNHGMEIVHLPELLITEIKNGKIDLNHSLDMKITYHDPCHLGRHMGMYEIPRELLKKIPGIELVEMERNRENAWCCGSGGGVRSAFKGLSESAANERIQEALETGADAIVSSCPFCLNQFKSNIKQEDLKAYDISELINKSF
ncbi:MAG: (Fe-S)-binding protein [Candidatus Lokiarchaeota archaeon]|nr:(Fe-S)-binding protein [Candidatus Lokiarchaeota archaeon]